MRTDDDDEADAEDQRREQARMDFLQNVCHHPHAGTDERCPDCDELLRSNDSEHERLLRTQDAGWTGVDQRRSE